MHAASSAISLCGLTRLAGRTAGQLSGAYASGVIGETERSEAFARLTVAVLPLALTLVPLAALLMGVSTAATDDATSFLLSQPVSRLEHLAGRWLGQAAALSMSLIAGFGTGGLIVSLISGANDVPGSASSSLPA